MYALRATPSGSGPIVADGADAMISPVSYAGVEVAGLNPTAPYVAEVNTLSWYRCWMPPPSASGSPV